MPKKILVADDEKELVEMIQLRLEANGYEVYTAFDGKEALNKAKEKKPDLIILDILMPEKEGTVVAAELKNYAPTANIPIIFLTCLAEGISKLKEAYKSGGNIFIAKPFDTEQLLSTIKGLLSK